MSELSKTKKPWASKTLWVSVIMAVAPLIPGVGAVIAANPELAGVVAGAIGAALRIVTDGKITLQ